MTVEGRLCSINGPMRGLTTRAATTILACAILLCVVVSFALRSQDTPTSQAPVTETPHISTHTTDMVVAAALGTLRPIAKASSGARSRASLVGAPCD